MSQVKFSLCLFFSRWEIWSGWVSGYLWPLWTRLTKRTSYTHLLSLWLRVSERMRGHQRRYENYLRGCIFFAIHATIQAFQGIIAKSSWYHLAGRFQFLLFICSVIVILKDCWGMGNQPDWVVANFCDEHSNQQLMCSASVHTPLSFPRHHEQLHSQPFRTVFMPYMHKRWANSSFFILANLDIKDAWSQQLIHVLWIEVCPN